MNILDDTGKLISPPIRSDFQGPDWDGRLRLDKRGSTADLARYELTLTEGMRLVLYDLDEDDQGRPDDLIAVGIVERDLEEGRWVCAVDWDEVDHVSTLEPPQQSTYRRFRPESIGRVRPPSRGT